MYPLLTGPLTVERVTVAIRNLPISLHGTTLVQLSDFHFDGHSLSQELLTAAIAQCNAIHPDLIVLTGDFITKDLTFMDELAIQLRQLNSRLGSYAVLGNHDNGWLSDRLGVQKALTANGIVTLWNDIAYPFGTAFPLVGLADFYSRECQPLPLLSQLDDSTPRLVLAHNPDTAALLDQTRADLILSGHTHGGQIVLPGVGVVPSYLKGVAVWIPKWARSFIPFLRKDCDRMFQHWEWASGLHTVGPNQLYVNRGLGSYKPGRLFCPPELTVITLVTP